MRSLAVCSFTSLLYVLLRIISNDSKQLQLHKCFGGANCRTESHMYSILCLLLVKSVSSFVSFEVLQKGSICCMFSCKLQILYPYLSLFDALPTNCILGSLPHEGKGWDDQLL